MIDQQLLIERAKDMDINVETDLVKRLDDVRKQNNLDTMEDLEKAVEGQGIAWEDYKTQIAQRHPDAGSDSPRSRRPHGYWQRTR